MKYVIKADTEIGTPAALPFGYKREGGTELGVNGRCFLKDGEPWYPTMGEFHFTRCHRQFWREEVAKMKAGGIQILATYVFWIHHEEKEGEWDFEGDRNLREFLQICRQENMPVWLRIGPWAHGECRSGGFPDWLLRIPGIAVRTDDEIYLSYAKRFFRKIYEQAEGLFWKDGGCILGIQIENEYGHCGGLTGKEGLQHMLTLKKLAVSIGFDAPFYTATGWGGAVVAEGETIPVLGAYCGAPWNQGISRLPLNANYIFSHYKNDENIGTDRKINEESGFSYDTTKYPYLTAELGGGLQPTSHRREYVAVQDTLSLAIGKLGSGANLLGYYMYHGGTNPRGKYTTLQESREAGDPNDLTVFSYDFQAPIGEFGRVTDLYYALRPLHMMLKQFGNVLADSGIQIAEFSADSPQDLDSPRVSLRHNERTGGGFLCINHYQRHAQLKELEDVSLEVEAGDKRYLFPEMQFKNGFCGLFPYHFAFGNGVLETANAQILCALQDTLVCYTDEKPVYRMESGTMDILTLTSEQARHAFLYRDRLYTAPGCLFEMQDKLYLSTYSCGNEVQVYPHGITKYCGCSETPIEVNIRENTPESDCLEYEVKVDFEAGEHLHNIWLEVSFQGDRAECYLDGELAGDWFYNGKTWNLSMAYYDFPAKLTLRIYPVKEEGVYYEISPSGTCELCEVKAVPEYLFEIE